MLGVTQAVSHVSSHFLNIISINIDNLVEKVYEEPDSP